MIVMSRPQTFVAIQIQPGHWQEAFEWMVEQGIRGQMTQNTTTFEEDVILVADGYDMVPAHTYDWIVATGETAKVFREEEFSAMFEVEEE